MVKYVAYSNKESVIIQSGVAAIEEVLLGTDVAAKESLLFCFGIKCRGEYSWK